MVSRIYHKVQGVIMKVAIVVICLADRGEHEELARVNKETFGRTATEDVKIFYVWGNNGKKKDNNDYVYPFLEDHGAVLKKTLAFFQDYKNEEYDYILRVNDGAYIDIPVMLEFLKDKPRERFYCGIPGTVVGINFASGSAFFLSRDLVHLIVDNMWQFHERHIDDVAIGEFMQNFGIPIDNRAVRVILHYDGKTRQIGDKVCTAAEFDESKCYHWRLRCDDGQRWVDCDHFRRLYETLHK